MKPEPCPLCGRKATIQTNHHGQARMYNIGCGEDTDTCGLVLFGDVSERRKDLIARWNSRHELWVHANSRR